MARRTFARTSGINRFVPFGLFGGQISGLILLGISFFLILLSAIRPPLFAPVRSGVQNILAPTLSRFSVPFTALAETMDYLFSLTQLKTEVVKLRADNKRLEEWYSTAQLLQAENQSLRDLLKVRVDPSLTFVTARVIGDTGGAYAQSIMIGAGRDQNLNPGDSVLAGGGLIGRVTDVYANAAIVLLITDLNSRIPVRLEGANLQAILAGDTQAGLSLDRIPDGRNVNSGVRVLTSGIGGVFPPDLPVGIVQVSTEDKRINVRPYADFSRLMFVRVVRQPAHATVIEQPITPTKTQEKKK